MTISVTVVNCEDPADATKDLMIELLRDDGAVYQTQTLKGGESATLAVHPYSRARLSERFTDRSKQSSKR